MASTRRTRYTAIVNGTPRVILAYTADQVARHYGVPLAAVSKGDFRTDAQRRTGASPRLSEVRQVAAMRNLRYPVEVVVRGHKGAKQGSHTFLFDRGRWVHRIVVKDWLSVERMGEVLHHELEHAVQTEALFTGRTLGREDIGMVQRTVRAAYNNGVGYRCKRWEVEARAAERNNATRPLAR